MEGREGGREGEREGGREGLSKHHAGLVGWRCCGRVVAVGRCLLEALVVTWRLEDFCLLSRICTQHLV